MNRLKEFLDPAKPLEGESYAIIGCVAFLAKFDVDHFIASQVFHRPWNLLSYWLPRANNVYLAGLIHQEPAFVLSILLASIPFMVFGILMTLRRLNTLRLPVWLSVLFFAPFVNVPFFALLSILTPNILSVLTPQIIEPPGIHVAPPKGPGRWIPKSPMGSALMAIAVTAAGALSLVGFNLTLFAKYGFALFFVLPFVHGLGAAWKCGYHQPRSLSTCQTVAIISCVAVAAGALVTAVEGAICIAMAAPLWLAMTAMGAWVGYEMQSVRWRGRANASILLLLVLTVPLLMGAEYAMNLPAPLLRVTSSIAVQAPPEVVWKHVVSFAELPPPKEWVFKVGVAYPIRARIYGHGEGAVRHCIFSTGPFIEPIQIWDAPRLLRFSVTANPTPMQELSIYQHLDPPHLHGYLVSKEGQFHLIPLADGGTRLEGTTWYEHNLWPAHYWQLWSDYIIHQIHLRVLRHIKALAESEVREETNHG